MRGEIISVGKELLSGNVTDTNSSFIAAKLTSLGVDVSYKTAVGDDRERLKKLIQASHKRSELIIVTGGLGPTVDDVTREAIASAFGSELEFRRDLMEEIKGFFRQRGLSISPNNKKQAYIPKGSEPIFNPVGTAPGFIIKDKKGVVISLPGVPREMSYLMENKVLPYLKKEFSLKEGVRARVLRLCWIGESKVDDAIGDLMEDKNNPPGLLVRDGYIEIHLGSHEQNEKKAAEDIERVEKEIRNRLGELIYGADHETIEGVVGLILKAKQKTVSIADSFTGGKLSSRFLNPDTNGEYFRGCFVFKDKASLRNGLKIKDERVRGNKLALISAREISRLCCSDIGLSVLGKIDNVKKSYSAFVALSLEDRTAVKELRFNGLLETAQNRVATLSLECLRRFLLNLKI